MATINASDILDRRPLPIDARDICTKVTLVIAGRPSGEAANIENVALGESLTYDPKTGLGSLEYQNVTHYPRPVVFEYEADEHSTYAAHKVFQLPADAYPFLPPTDSSIPDPEDSSIATTNAPLLRDGDPETGYPVNLSSSNPFWIEYYMSSSDGAPRIVGWRVMYWMEFITLVDKPPHIQFSTRSGRADGETADVVTRVMWAVPPTHDGAEVVVADLWATCHADARQIVEANDGLIRDTLSWRRLSGTTGQMAWRLIHFYPLVLDEDYLEEIAKAHIRLPASSPERVTVRGVIPIEESHDVDGDELVVARQTYQDGVTIIDFEQAGSPVGVASEAFEAERVRLIREATARASSLYPLTMGER